MYVTASGRCGRRREFKSSWMGRMRCVGRRWPTEFEVSEMGSSELLEL